MFVILTQYMYDKWRAWQVLWVRAQAKLPWIDKTVLCNWQTHLPLYYDKNWAVPERWQNCPQSLFSPIPCKCSCLHLHWVHSRQNNFLLFKVVNTLFIVPGHSVPFFTIQRLMCLKPVITVKLGKEKVDFFFGGVIWVCKKRRNP